MRDRVPNLTRDTADDRGATGVQLLRLLAVEDEFAYVGFIDMMLRTMHPGMFELSHAPSLHRAIEHLEARPFDLVLLDLGLGDATGLEALQTLITAAPETPVVVLSGDDDLALAARAVQAGAQDYLPKNGVTSDSLTRSILYAIERKRSERQTRSLALRDSLTRLPNRYLLREYLHVALERAKRGRTAVGIFFIDIDHFKQINDTLGHEAGDTILQQVARRLQASLRGSDTLARLSGDEFVAIVETNRRADLPTVADSISRQFRSAFTVDAEEVFITLSLGVSSYPADGVDGDTLLRNADRAMYRAKAEGRDTHRFYSPRHHTKASRSLAFRSDLRHAIERNELVLHFQPLVNLRGRGVDGVEALVRWQHPTMGLIPPAEFIPIAEESGLILSIERWVLEAAMRQVAAVASNGPLKVAVNLSTRHFDHPALLTELRTVTHAAAFDPHHVELELTESGIMHDPKRVLQHLKAFRRLGVRVAVDDFGTGYSCLSLMNRFPLHALKIDRSFVRDCATNPTNQVLVAAIIRMGHALGLEVTAEGVETIEQLTFLQGQDCDRAQGFLFSPGVPGSELSQVCEELARFRHDAE